MEQTYRLIVLDRLGEMYSYGQNAATPELARLVPADLRPRSGERLGVERVIWGANDRGGRSIAMRVLVDAEPSPGDWDIPGVIRPH